MLNHGFFSLHDVSGPHNRRCKCCTTLMKLRKHLVLCPFEELRTEGKRHNRFLQMRTHKIQSVTLTRNYLFVFMLAM